MVNRVTTPQATGCGRTTSGGASAGAPHPDAEARIQVCLVTSVAINIKAFFRGQFAYLRRFGIASTVIAGEATREGLELPDDTAYYSVPITRTITPWQDLVAICKLVRLFRREHFDLVQYTTPKGALLASIAAFLARVPVRLYLLWGLYYVGQSGFRRTAFKTLERLICRLSTHVTFDGFGLRRFALEEGLCRAEHSSVVGHGGDNGIDLGVFDPEAWRDAGRRVRRTYGIPDDAVVIGSVMRLVGDKGINELVAAFARTAAERPNTYLLLVGGEEEKDRPRPETRKQLAEDAHIRVTGFQDNVLPYYAAMDVFALPTYREGFSAVTLEAAAMALPVVTTDTIGAAETIIEGETGFAVPVKSVDELTAALMKLVDDSGLRRTMGLAGRHHVVEKFEQRGFWEAVRRHREDLLVAGGGFSRVEGSLVRRPG